MVGDLVVIIYSSAYVQIAMQKQKTVPFDDFIELSMSRTKENKPLCVSHHNCIFVWVYFQRDKLTVHDIEQCPCSKEKNKKQYQYQQQGSVEWVTGIHSQPPRASSQQGSFLINEFCRMFLRGKMLDFGTRCWPCGLGLCPQGTSLCIKMGRPSCIGWDQPTWDFQVYYSSKTTECPA